MHTSMTGSARGSSPKFLRRSALLITLTELADIAAATMIGMLFLAENSLRAVD